MNLKRKLFASAVAFSMVLSVVAVPVAGQTTAELTAQINSLLAMIAQLQAQIAGQGGSVQGPAIQYNSDLTIGSTGADVTALQQFLVSKGYLQMPVNASYGYFGSITQAALGRYQASVGISPAAGYFGPITRAHVNSLAGTPGTPGTPTTPGGTGITTPGVEGTLSVTSNNSGLVSTAYEGDSMVSVLGFDVEAKSSDIAVQRIKLQLGTDSSILWRKGYSRLYVTSGGDTLASIDLNSSTVVKEGSHYFVTVTGFNLVVPKDSEKHIVIKADVMSSIDSVDMDGSADSLDVEPLILVTNGVRGIDGAGIDQYSPTSGTIERLTNFSEDLAESASLKISLNSSSPDVSSFVADEGSGDNELDKVTVLIFDAKAEKDNVEITDLTLTVSTTTGSALFPTFYLFDGSTEIDNASYNGSGTVTFNDVDLMVSKDSTKTLTVKVDVRSAQSAASDVRVSVATAGVDFENSVGDSEESTGAATGRYISFTKDGGQVTLVSKSVTTTGVPLNNGTDVSTSTLTASFNVKVRAAGGDLVLGTTASSAPVFATSTTFMQVYRNGAPVSVDNAAVSYTVPSTCVANTPSTNSCTLSDGNEVTIPVTFLIYGRSANGGVLPAGLYSVGLEGLQLNSGNITFMDGLTDWRTAEVSFP